MSARIDRDSLALGACYALSHAVQVLEDAAALYSHKRASSSFHFAVMAREELGRFNLLSEQHYGLSTVETIDAKELAQSLQPHKIKLQAGQSVVPVPMTPKQFATWTAAIHRNDESTLAAVSKEVRLRAKKLKPHQVEDLHQRRLKAQYVDLDPHSGQWSKPSDVSMADASALIRTVVAEISNALLTSHGVAWLNSTFHCAGVALPQMGPFTHRVYQYLGTGDV